MRFTKYEKQLKNVTYTYLHQITKIIGDDAQVSNHQDFSDLYQFNLLNQFDDKQI